MKILEGKTLVLGITGSIAAYKAADLVRLLREDGADVHCILTEAGARFITPLTLKTLSRNPVAGDLWQDHGDWQPPHIALADRADALIVAPATADCLARFAHGLANDELTSLYLAFRRTVILAPAMNGHMWQHPATRENCATLAKRGHHFIGPEEGMLACGYEGTGRLLNLESLREGIRTILAPGQPQS